MIYLILNQFYKRDKILIYPERSRNILNGEMAGEKMLQFLIVYFTIIILTFDTVNYSFDAMVYGLSNALKNSGHYFLLNEITMSESFFRHFV